MDVHKLEQTSSFAALSAPNFRRFVSGQSISLVGSWTETVAQALLVLQLTHSPMMLGLATAARYLPVLVFTPYAGVLVDRYDKRHLLMITATVLGLLSLITGTLVATGVIVLWHVFVLALGFGCMSAMDNPARQAFIPEMVEPGLVRNAVTLNSTFVNVGRAVGPLVAAVLVSTTGLAWCFYVNAASFAAVLVALATMHVAGLNPVVATRRAAGQFRQGLRYAVTVPEIVGPVAMMALIGTLTYEFEVSLPVFAKYALHGTPSTYSWLIAAFGAGSVIGGLWNTRHPATGLHRLIVTSALYGCAMLATGLAPDAWLAVPLLFLVGLTSITFLTSGNSTIQLAAPPTYRGRVTALWSTAFLGSTPLGAPIIGAIGNVSAAATLFVGAAACGAASVLGVVLSRRGTTHPHTIHTHPSIEGAESEVAAHWPPQP